MESVLLFFILTITTARLYRGFEGSVLELIINAGLVVKLVLLILLIFSIVSWAIIFFKFKLLRKAERETKEFLRIFQSKKDLSVIYSESRKYRQSPLAEIFRKGFTELNKLKKDRDQKSRETIPSEDIDGVDRVLRQTNTAQTIQLERNLSFLATTGNAAPFIGLFGTVWGIMEAFHKIGQRGATSLAIVAPGISEALIATAAGLFAAIPAVIAYNYFLHRIRNLIAEMDNFTDEFLNIIKRYS